MRMHLVIRILSLAILVSLATACHPGPNFVHKGVSKKPSELQAVLHGVYRYEDPWKVMPAWGPCWIEQVDGTKFTRDELMREGNNILLSPGLHWFVVRVTSPIGPDYSAAFEIDFEAGREYALYFPPTCTAFGRKVVKRSTIGIETVVDSGDPPVTELEGICSRRGQVCRQDDNECSAGQHCIKHGETGFGLCGRY